MKLRIDVEGKSYEVTVQFLSNGHAVTQNGRNGELVIPDSVTEERPPQKLPEDRFCRCPITGRVVSILATPGQKVRKNEPVVVIEAMKMEINAGPAVDGVVEIIHVTPGEMVKTGQVLFELI